MRFYVLIATLVSACNALQFSPLFTNDMVLQREPKVARVFGAVESGNTDVSVTLTGPNSYSKVFAGSIDGSIWSVDLEALPSSFGPYTVTVTSTGGTNPSIAITGVKFGDVYLCSGQSNMEMRLDQMFHQGPTLSELSAVTDGDIMFFQVTKNTQSATPVDILTAHDTPTWMSSQAIAADATLQDQYSGTCASIALGLYYRLGAQNAGPLAFISAAHGGTSAGRWLPASGTTACAGKGIATHANDNQLYNGMIHPLTRMVINGVAWFQGEADSTSNTGDIRDGTGYACALEQIVTSWRAAWSDTDIHFFIATLGGEGGGGTYDQLPRFRNVQMRTAYALTNAHIVHTYPLNDPWIRVNANICGPNDHDCADIPCDEDLDSEWCALPLTLEGRGNNPRVHPRTKRSVGARIAAAMHGIIYAGEDVRNVQVSSCAVSGQTVSFTVNTGDDTFWVDAPKPVPSIALEYCNGTEIECACPFWEGVDEIKNTDNGKCVGMFQSENIESEGASILSVTDLRTIWHPYEGEIVKTSETTFEITIPAGVTARGVRYGMNSNPCCDYSRAMLFDSGALHVPCPLDNCPFRTSKYDQAMDPFLVEIRGDSCELSRNLDPTIDTTPASVDASFRNFDPTTETTIAYANSASCEARTFDQSGWGNNVVQCGTPITTSAADAGNTMAVCADLCFLQAGCKSWNRVDNGGGLYSCELLSCARSYMVPTIVEDLSNAKEYGFLQTDRYPACDNLEDTDNFEFVAQQTCNGDYKTITRSSYADCARACLADTWCDGFAVAYDTDGFTKCTLANRCQSPTADATSDYYGRIRFGGTEVPLSARVVGSYCKTLDQKINTYSDRDYSHEECLLLCFAETSQPCVAIARNIGGSNYGNCHTYHACNPGTLETSSNLEYYLLSNTVEHGDVIDVHSYMLTDLMTNHIANANTECRATELLRKGNVAAIECTGGLLSTVNSITTLADCANECYNYNTAGPVDYCLSFNFLQGTSQCELLKCYVRSGTVNTKSAAGASDQTGFLDTFITSTFCTTQEHHDVSAYPGQTCGTNVPIHGTTDLGNIGFDACYLRCTIFDYCAAFTLDMYGACKLFSECEPTAGVAGNDYLYLRKSFFPTKLINYQASTCTGGTLLTTLSAQTSYSPRDCNEECVAYVSGCTAFTIDAADDCVLYDDCPSQSTAVGQSSFKQEGFVPTSAPTNFPTHAPSPAPTVTTTEAPTDAPSTSPTKAPTLSEPGNNIYQFEKSTFVVSSPTASPGRWRCPGSDTTAHTNPLAANTAEECAQLCLDNQVGRDTTHNRYCDMFSFNTGGNVPNGNERCTLYKEVCAENDRLQADSQWAYIWTGPTDGPTVSPSASPTTSPTPPTNAPTDAPTTSPTPPTNAPTESPTVSGATPAPTDAPSTSPTTSPTASPTPPTNAPTNAPSTSPSTSPTKSPTPPTNAPTDAPTKSPTTPTLAPTGSPTRDETVIGKAEVALSIKNPTNRKLATQQVLSDAVTNYDGDAADLSFLVDGTETIRLNNALLEQIGGDEAQLKAALAATRGCSECTVTFGSSRRVLQSGDTFVVSIDYTLSDSGYNAMETNGHTFDDPQFLADLAADLGVHADNITITSVGGEIEIDVTLTLANDPENPFDESAINALKTIKANLDQSAQTVITNFGGAGDSFSATALDLCGTNNCSGHGTCDSNTGFCDCTGTYWGITCASECACNNGGECYVGADEFGTMACACEYPYYGKKCADSVACDQCA